MKRLLLIVLIALLQFVPAYAKEFKRTPKPILLKTTQFGLTYQGRPTSMGCTPFAIAYLTSLMGHPLSAQYILDSNARQGTFTWQGMSPSNAHDELAQAGFHAHDFYGATPSVPFLAVVRMHGGNHSIVVTSMSDGVTFFDPWDGHLHVYSQDGFNSVWSCRCGMAI